MSASCDQEDGFAYYMGWGRFNNGGGDCLTTCLSMFENTIGDQSRRGGNETVPDSLSRIFSGC